VTTYNLLADPKLWHLPAIFDCLLKQTVHGRPLGSDSISIAKTLRAEFNLQENIFFDIESQLEADGIIDKAKSDLQKFFDPSEITVFICGINDSENFAKQNLGGVSG
jgi:hypothetical protein